jgi:hypothetical protein
MKKLGFYAFGRVSGFDYNRHYTRRQKHMATTSDTKSKKPYPDFSLFAHSVGQWTRIKRKMWYIGTLSDADAAIRKYLDEVDEIQAGRDPRKTPISQRSRLRLSF